MRRLAIALFCVLAGSAHAADPGRWTQTGQSTLPLYWYQGITTDPAGNLYGDGVYFGLYRADSQLNETARNFDVIPPDVHATEHFDHIGDISYDGAEGGRILLPMECYYPVPTTDGNPCQQGGIGVADPATLQWRYYVKPDPAAEGKVMWIETSPNGKLLWTPGGPTYRDLVAFRASDVSAANAGKVIEPVRIIHGAIPAAGSTGAAFVGNEFFIASQDGDTFRVLSIDLDDDATGPRATLEIERTIVGESEGLTTASVNGGVLQWLIQPYNTHNKPTYGFTNATLLSFKPSPSRVPPGE